MPATKNQKIETQIQVPPLAPEAPVEPASAPVDEAIRKAMAFTPCTQHVIFQGEADAKCLRCNRAVPADEPTGRLYSTKTFSEHLRIEEDSGRALLTFLASVKLAENLGSAKQLGRPHIGPGKGPNFYAITPGAADRVALMLRTL